MKSIISESKTHENTITVKETETVDSLKFNIEPFYIQENAPLDDY